MKEPLKIGIDVWRKEFIKWNESLVIPYDTPPIHVMVVSFYKYLEDKNKNNESGVKCSNSAKL
jgi:hypothetical protein